MTGKTDGEVDKALGGKVVIDSSRFQRGSTVKTLG